MCIELTLDTFLVGWPESLEYWLALSASFLVRTALMKFATIMAKHSVLHPYVNDDLDRRARYYLFSVCALTGMLYVLTALPPSASLSAILISYSHNQVSFVATHMMLHVTFITKPIALARYPDRFRFGTWVAYHHHYKDVNAFTKYWIPYRLAYAHPIIILPDIIWISFSALLCGISMTTLIPTLALLPWWLNTQAIVHEWYHALKAQRSELTPWTRGYMRFLETTGIISTSAHRLHHAEDKSSLFAASHFSDMWVPACIDRAFEIFFSGVLITKIKEKYGEPHEIDYEETQLDEIGRDQLFGNKQRRRDYAREYVLSTIFRVLGHVGVFGLYRALMHLSMKNTLRTIAGICEFAEEPEETGAGIPGFE